MSNPTLAPDLNEPFGISEELPAAKHQAWRPILSGELPLLSDCDRESAIGGSPAPDSAPDLIEWLYLERNTLAHQLRKELDYQAGLMIDCEEMCDRLNRVGSHLERLTDYAYGTGHEGRNDPPRDPFPEPSKRRKKKATR